MSRERYSTTSCGELPRLGWGAGLCALLALFVAACAQTGPPPGGPVDETPPRFLSAQPGSLALRVDPLTPLVLDFSEKVDRRGFRGSIHFAPEIRVREIGFDATTVTVRPETGWPKDTLVVWTLLPTLSDRHKVKLGSPVSGAFTTGDTIPEGMIKGQVAGEDLKLDQVVAQLSALGTATSKKPVLWRMVAPNELGFFRLGLLASPSGPYDLQIFEDKNKNGKRDKREPTAEQDSLYLSAGSPVLDLGTLTLVDLEAPVDLLIRMQLSEADSFPVRVALRPIGVEDARVQTTTLDTLGSSKSQLTPGEYRISAWLDLDNDNHFGPAEEGLSEPFVAETKLEIQPAHPDSLILPRPSERASWAELDTMRTPPLPRSLFLESAP